MKPEEIIDSRAKTHGDYEKAAELEDKIFEALENMDSWYSLEPRHRKSLRNIVTKMARIMAGDPNFPDHWEDIAGYALLAAKTSQGDE